MRLTFPANGSMGRKWTNNCLVGPKCLFLLEISESQVINLPDSMNTDLFFQARCFQTTVAKVFVLQEV